MVLVGIFWGKFGKFWGWKDCLENDGIFGRFFIIFVLFLGIDEIRVNKKRDA
jgi:hypothetical protein